MCAGLRSRLGDLEAEVAECDALRQGQITSLEAESIVGIGAALIKARIVRKLTQKDLAELLDLAERQIQRYGNYSVPQRGRRAAAAGGRRAEAAGARGVHARSGVVRDLVALALSALLRNLLRPPVVRVKQPVAAASNRTWRRPSGTCVIARTASNLA